MAIANSHDTSNVLLHKFLTPMSGEQNRLKFNKGNHSPVKGHLSPIQPSLDLTILNKVTFGSDRLRVETVFHPKVDFNVTHSSGLTKVTGVMGTCERGVITRQPSPVINIPPMSSMEEDNLMEPLVRPVLEERKVEILKSIVYGGLIESITSFGVISSAAGSGASTLNILVLGLANLLGGLILIANNLQELREEEHNQTNGEEEEEDRYKRVLGRRENFVIHASVAILSFIIVGLLPPVVYYFSFNKTHNKHYKVASVFGSSLLCIVLLAIAKAHVKTPRGGYLKSVVYYAVTAVSVSVVTYIVGKFVNQLLEKYGWSDGSETLAGEMMVSLMGRKAGSFGHSSS